LGARPLQQLQPTEIDALYQKLEGKVAPRTAHRIHTVFGSCLTTAVRKGLLAANPLEHAEKVPSPGESDHGMVLDGDQLRTLVEGFKGSVLFPIVAVAAFTGARRNEILALRWSDLDKNTLRIERAIEQVHGQPLALKAPRRRAASAQSPSMMTWLRCCGASGRSSCASWPACPRARRLICRS
jgi:integrase